MKNPDRLAGAFVFVLLYGFCMGGVVATLPAIIARMFGVLSFPVIWGAVALFLVFQGMGHPLMGLSHDMMDSYIPAYGLFCIFYVIAALLVLSTKKPLKEVTS